MAALRYGAVVCAGGGRAGEGLEAFVARAPRAGGRVSTSTLAANGALRNFVEHGHTRGARAAGYGWPVDFLQSTFEASAQSFLETRGSEGLFDPER